MFDDINPEDERCAACGALMEEYGVEHECDADEIDGVEHTT